MNIKFGTIPKFRTKNKRKSGFVSNKIKTFTYISYKHESYRKAVVKRNCFRKINSILGTLKLSFYDAVEANKGKSNKLTRALSFAMRREDFQLAYHIESLRVRLEKLAHLQAKKHVSLLCLYFNVLFVICYSAIPIFRNLRIYRLSEGEATADILCTVREVIHRIKRRINPLVWSVWKHKPHPPHGKNPSMESRRNYKIGEPPACQVMCVSEAIILTGNERVNKLGELLRLKHLSSNQFRDIKSILTKYSDRFYLTGDIMPATNVIEREIPTTTNIPIRIKQFRHPPVLKEEMNRQVKEMLEKGIVEPSTSAYSAPVFCVDKKPGPDGKKKFRVVVDFRKLNTIIPDYNHPVPNIADILDQLGDAKFFSCSIYTPVIIKSKLKLRTEKKQLFLANSNILLDHLLD